MKDATACVRPKRPRTYVSAVGCGAGRLDSFCGALGVRLSRKRRVLLSFALERWAFAHRLALAACLFEPFKVRSRLIRVSDLVRNRRSVAGDRRVNK